MNALIEQLAAAGNCWIGAPFALVTEPAAVTVPATDIQQGPQLAGSEDCSCLGKSRMKAVIEANFDNHLALGAGFGQGPQLHRTACARFLDQDVLASAKGGMGDRGEHVVGGGNDDGIDVIAAQQVLPIG